MGGWSSDITAPVGLSFDGLLGSAATIIAPAEASSDLALPVPADG
jgi:hypothetical protein